MHKETNSVDKLVSFAYMYCLKRQSCMVGSSWYFLKALDLLEEYPYSRPLTMSQRIERKLYEQAGGKTW